VPKPYQVWLRQVAYDYLESIEPAERQRLLVWVERLGQHPEKEGDFSEMGSDGRPWQVSIVAAHAVAWWVDSPVREVKIVEIRRGDR
jgi:hypothetical protein